MKTDNMKKHDNWSHIIYKDSKEKFCYSYSFYEPAINSHYANWICIFLDYSLFVILCVDENYHNKILGFSLMPNRATMSFINFLIIIKKRVGNIKVFLTDRFKAQIEALKSVWPEAKIIYCAV